MKIKFLKYQKYLFKLKTQNSKTKLNSLYMKHNIYLYILLLCVKILSKRTKNIIQCFDHTYYIRLNCQCLYK